LRRIRIADYQYQDKKEPDFQKIAQDELKICFLPKLLNQISSVSKRYSAFREAPEKKGSEMKSELESLKKNIDKMMEAWANISSGTLYHLADFLESPNKIQMEFIDLLMRIEDAINNIEIKPGPKTDEASKSSYVIYLIDLAKIYKEATGNKPKSGYVNSKTGEPGGPFLRFTYKCLKSMGTPPQSPESLRKDILNLKSKNLLPV